jgi:hypothetical protein
MDKYERLLRYLSKNFGSIIFSKDYKGNKLITVKIEEKIITVVSSVKEVLEKLKKELDKIK